MIKQTLLIEIGTEELPARLLHIISSSFYKNMNKELNIYNISYKNMQLFFTPRRLALKIIDINTTEKIVEVAKKGPSIIDSYDKNGYPTVAATRWAKHCRINLNQASRLKTEKGEWLLYKVKQKQENIKLLASKIIENALKKIIIQKPMRWEVNNQKFSRPIRNIIILLDNELIKGKIFNIFSNNFLHDHLCLKEEKIRITHAKEYPLILFKKASIIADYEIRKQTILKKINKIAQKVNGFIQSQNVLIEEVTSLVESPAVFLASFNKKFLNIPKKILIFTIEKQQKCFPIYNSKKEILPYFAFVSNINPKNPKNIIIGNEKVMHARMSDAEFFFKNDRKIKLSDYLFCLKKVVFQNNLGSLYKKTLRLTFLIKWISKYIGSNIEDSIRAAFLSKCDLVTNMVCEFPELQGIIGMYYALEDQEKKDVAIALKEQYLPSFSGDKIPSTLIGCSLSIVDKIDTLSGMFYIGNIPKSDKDPFALRRLAIAILRIIILKNIPLNLQDLIKKSLYLYNQEDIKNKLLCDKITKFFMTRLFNWYEEIGYHKKIIQSILSSPSTDLIDINKKIQDMSIFIKSEHSKSIILLIKRISYILEKEDKKITGHFNITLIQEIEERVLFHSINNFNTYTRDLFSEKKYREIFLKIQELEKPIYNFFNKVKVHHDNYQIRFNRLILLKKLKKIFFKIADFSYLY